MIHRAALLKVSRSSHGTNNGHVTWGHCEQWPLEQRTFALSIWMCTHTRRAEPHQFLGVAPPRVVTLATSHSSSSLLSSLRPVILSRHFYGPPQLLGNRPLLFRGSCGLEVRGEGQWLTQVHEFRRSLFRVLLLFFPLQSRDACSRFMPLP